MISIAQLHWIAGLLEGEGYFGCHRKTRQIHIQLLMTDGDVVGRKAVGL